MSPSRSRVALALLVVGLVLLPGPAYAIGLERLDEPERHRSSTGYVATPIEAQNDSVLAERYAHEVTFETGDFEYRHVAADYRAPNRTARALERASRIGATTVDDRAVRRDLRRLRHNYSLFTVDDVASFAFRVETNDDGVRLRATRANESDVARAVRDELVVDYGTLPPAERATFRKIRNATRSDERYDYRPWADEPVPRGLIVERDGTYYAVEAASATDDIGFPDGLFLGLVGSVVGVVSLAAAGAVELFDRLSG
jgi:hypothetical protein